MTNRIDPPTTGPGAPERRAGGAALWVVTALVVLAAAAGTYYWFAVRSGADPRMQALMGKTVAQASAQLQQDAEIAAFIDSKIVQEDQVVLSGWALDKTHKDKPVSLLFFVSDKAVGSAEPAAARPDVEPLFSLPAGTPIAFEFAMPKASCPTGQPVAGIALSENNRFAPVSFWKMDAVCP